MLWRRDERYVIRDSDGQPVSVSEGRSIVAERYSVPAEVRDSASARAPARDGQRPWYGAGGGGRVPGSTGSRRAARGAAPPEPKPTAWLGQ